MSKIPKLLAAVFWLFSAAVSHADLAVPEGRVLLTVSGSISTTNTDESAVFDRAMLQQLDWREIETHTSFTQGPQVFAGPTLSSLLEAVGSDGALLTATAVNDYAVEIPAEHAEAHNVILAMDMNGKPMRIRDKGPIWVVYPLGAADAARKPFDNEMIWQLNRIAVQ
ncbi:MAG: molybdopterin-dependent oxidoreductase [Pseudomonadota bacterium]